MEEGTNGRHLIINIKKIKNKELLKTVDQLKNILDTIVQLANLNVIGYIGHQFYPVGATAIYLLSESHLSAHTYYQKRSCSIDIYTCNFNTNFDLILEYLYLVFDHPYIDSIVEYR